MRLTFSMLLAVAGIFVTPLSYAQTQPAGGPAAGVDSAMQEPRATVTANPGPTARLAAMMPAGMTAETACLGFKSLSDCSAALHVSQNLNIPFADVRDRMASGQSLAIAVHALQPSADLPKEVRRAEDQAREDMKPGS